MFLQKKQQEKDDQRTKWEIPDAIHRQQINSVRARRVLYRNLRMRYLHKMERMGMNKAGGLLDDQDSKRQGIL